MTRENTSSRRKGKYFLYKWETRGFSLWFGRGGMCREGGAGEDLQRGQKGHGRETSKEMALAVKQNQTKKRIGTSRHAWDIMLSDKGQK